MTAKLKEFDCSAEIARSCVSEFFKLFSKLRLAVSEEGHETL